MYMNRWRVTIYISLLGHRGWIWRRRDGGALDSRCFGSLSSEWSTWSTGTAAELVSPHLDGQSSVSSSGGGFPYYQLVDQLLNFLQLRRLRGRSCVSSAVFAPFGGFPFNSSTSSVDRLHLAHTHLRLYPHSAQGHLQ
jgi:hypothetical protein